MLPCSCRTCSLRRLPLEVAVRGMREELGSGPRDLERGGERRRFLRSCSLGIPVLARCTNSTSSVVHNVFYAVADLLGQDLTPHGSVPQDEDRHGGEPLRTRTATSRLYFEVSLQCASVVNYTSFSVLSHHAGRDATFKPICSSWPVTVELWNVRQRRQDL